MVNNNNTVRSKTNSIVNIRINSHIITKINRIKCKTNGTNLKTSVTYSRIMEINPKTLAINNKFKDRIIIIKINTSLISESNLLK